jgi:argininosuccinate lyase
MAKLWQKKGMQGHPAVNNYIISKNLDADTKLIKYDLLASMAHATMLGEVGLLSKQEAEDLVAGLQEIEGLLEKGEFELSRENEDMHTAIENYLTQKLGETGKRIHLGRSRNDQVLTALRLFTKDNLLQVKTEIKELAQVILTFAKEYELLPMPGYTHTQRAMPSSIGQWATAFVESLLDDLTVLDSAVHLVDQNPLGSAAGYGTGLPIDREMTTKLLGFSRVQVNPIYCQNSRGKIEAYVLSCLSQVMETLAKVANDTIWFSSKEFGFLEIDDSLTTGSSIMPQKKNLDIMEVVRANSTILQSNQFQLQTVGKNLISGYHKDLKITKQTVINSLEITQDSLEIVKLLFTNMKPNQAKLQAVMDPEIFATDEVNKLAGQGMPFREAYKQIGENLNKLQNQDPVENIKSKKHLGATANLGINNLEKRLKEV